MAMELDYKKIGERIRGYRTASHMTQDTLSELCGVNPSTISRIETNAKSCSLSLLVSIANSLNVTLDSLMCDNLTAIKDAQLDRDFEKLLSDCSPKEKSLLLKILSVTKQTLREEGKNHL